MYRLVVHLSTHYVNVMHAGVLDYVAKSHNLFYYFVKYMSTSILFTVDLIQFIRPKWVFVVSTTAAMWCPPETSATRRDVDILNDRVLKVFFVNASLARGMQIFFGNNCIFRIQITCVVRPR